VAIWLGGFDLYAQLAAGDPDAVKRFAPRVAAMAAAAGKQRASAPLASSRAPAANSGALPSSHFRNTSMTISLARAAPQASRAGQVAEIHLAGINASRKRCGLAPLTASELAREFADVDRVPFRTKGVVPGTSPNQAADAMWSGIVGKLNASLPSRRPSVGSSGERAAAAGCRRSTQGAIDSMWAGIATGLNAEAGIKTPVRTNAR
jgi:hypothetical protein